MFYILGVLFRWVLSLLSERWVALEPTRCWFELKASHEGVNTLWCFKWFLENWCIAFTYKEIYLIFQAFILHLTCSVFQAEDWGKAHIWQGAFAIQLQCQKHAKRGVGWTGEDFLIVGLVLGFCTGVVISQKNMSETSLAVLLVLRWLLSNVRHGVASVLSSDLQILSELVLLQWNWEWCQYGPSQERSTLSHCLRWNKSCWISSPLLYSD